MKKFRRQTREIVKEIGRLDAERRRDRKAHEAALKKIVSTLGKFDTRIHQVEKKHR